MELRLLDHDADSVRVEVVNPDDTVLYPLVRHLLDDERVEDARYITGHPQLDRPTLLVRVKEGDPQSVLREAAGALSDRYGEIRASVQEALEKAG